MFTAKQLVGLVVAGTTLVGVGLYCALRNPVQPLDHWEEQVNHSNEALNKAYNEAIGAHPSDHNKASFAFELKADELEKAYTVIYSEHPRFEEWLKQYQLKVQNHLKAIRKG